MNVARVFVVAALAGCQPLAPVVDDTDKQAITSLQETVSELSNQVSNLERTASAATSTHEDVSTELTAHSVALARVETVIASLPDMIKAACPPAPRQVAAQCDKAEPVRIPVRGDKMIVGMREHVFVDPFEQSLVARVDAGSSGNVLYVADLVEFQRDGNNWARFSLTPPKAEAPVEVERQITRRKGTDESAKDVNVRLRMTLGNVTETYEFTLQTRKARDYQVRLGRTFLKDIALVDVSKRFIQPRPRPDGP